MILHSREVSFVSVFRREEFRSLRDQYPNWIVCFIALINYLNRASNPPATCLSEGPAFVILSNQPLQHSLSLYDVFVVPLNSFCFFKPSPEVSDLNFFNVCVYYFGRFKFTFWL